MTAFLLRWGLYLSTAGCLLLLYAIFSGHRLPDLSALARVPNTEWQSLKTVFVSIFLEALPFILLGVFVSSALHLFVSEDQMQRWIPRHPVLGILTACALGIVLPVCECGMIPIVRRLIRKGMPVYIGITYLLAAPILNPVAFAATAMAFRLDPRFAYYRVGLAFAVAAAAGLALYLFAKKNPLLPEKRSRRTSDAAHAHDHGHHHHDHDHGHEHSHAQGSNRLLAVFTHAADEFFEMGKYLMLGAFLTAIVQTFVSREELASLSGGTFGSHVLMMGFAYLISLCSTSDAFVASSFLGTFPKGALLAFLVFGPMVDFKNTLMMLAAFKRRFVANLIVLIAALVLVGSLLAGQWLH